MSDRYFEDFQVGEVFKSDGVTLTESSVIDFALHYDPQPFHMDAEAAKSSLFGRLAASGMQSLALSLRLYVDLRIFRASNMGGLGIDRLRWHKPVYPGDTIHVTIEITGHRPSATRSDRGYVELLLTTRNQAGEKVLTFETAQVVKRRAT
ncbi:MAG: MaoC family dehydratase [Alphaproteobacteria bacterium]